MVFWQKLGGGGFSAMVTQSILPYPCKEILIHLNEIDLKTITLTIDNRDCKAGIFSTTKCIAHKVWSKQDCSCLQVV